MNYTLCFLMATVTPTYAPEKEQIDLAIEKGLGFLRKTQNSDGSWSKFANSKPKDNSAFGRVGHPVMTSLCVMAFLASGKVPGEGEDGQRIEKGIRYVIKCQKNNGIIADVNDGMIEMYSHGICTLMLAEALGMTTGDLSEELRRRLVVAVQVILSGQRKSGADAGGWRYRIEGSDSDLSVTGWQLMALRAAKNVGCDVPNERIKLAVEYCRRCFDPATKGFRYQPNGPVTVACTGTGILAIEICGKDYHLSKEVVSGGDYILETFISANRPHFFYGIYYTSQGMFQLGGEYWSKYREKLHGILFASNPQNSDGSWTGKGGWDDEMYGSAYGTAMAILSLTVEYRYLPIYQRFEEPIEVDP
jgi:hypothetical protein